MDHRLAEALGAEQELAHDPIPVNEDILGGQKIVTIEKVRHLSTKKVIRRKRDVIFFNNGGSHGTGWPNVQFWPLCRDITTPDRRGCGGKRADEIS
jgi:hypothetical protein